jgi:negative regulator of flagellin synthesis FlgM
MDIDPIQSSNPQSIGSPDAVRKQNAVDRVDSVGRRGLPTEATSASSDKVEISERSRELSRALDEVNSTPEVRAERVAELKAKIEAGTYNVSAEDVAQSLLGGDTGVEQ